MKPRLGKQIFIFSLSIMLLFLITSCKSEANVVVKTLKVHYIDVGQADSILIQSNGANMLIDAGNRDDDTTVINYLKKQGVNKLDIIIGTHPHEDHIGAMAAVVNAFKADKIIMPKVTNNTKTFQNLLQTIKSKGLKITTPVPGSTFKIGESDCIILAPNSSNYKDLNNNSIVIKMTFGKTSFMFNGDAEDVSEKEILEKGYDLKADVLKLGHHGSHSSSTEAFLDKVHPKYAIISCGTGNDYGHPHDVTIKKLLSRNITFYRTDVNGNIICTSDGNKLSFTTSKTSVPNNTITPDSPKGVKVTGTNNTNSTNSTINKELSNKNNNMGAINASTIVYITKSGKAYHNDGCNGLSNSKIKITLGEAIKKGYTPHKQCDAPILKTR